MKITKSRLKQIILEEVKEILNPDSMEEDVDEDRSEPPHVPQITLEEERTVADDIKGYVSRIKDSNHSIWTDQGAVIIKRQERARALRSKMVASQRL